MIQALKGIVWQCPPRVYHNERIKDSPPFYVYGIERVETEGTAGWRATERTLYLQEDGTWSSARLPHYFASEESAEAALVNATGQQNAPATDSPFAAALARAREQKKK